MSNVARLHAQHALEAAGYIRVSLKRQADGYSPDVQRAAIKRLAAQEGYALTLIEEDHERGSKVTREGYQRVIEAVRQGTVHAVLVFMFDRWGRDGSEWLTRAREFERLGVPIISVQEGKDEGGLMRFMRAGMAEEYSRQLARRVRPAREAAARSGTHMGRTPFGYKRVYPAWDGGGRRPPGRLVPDEATAWIVRELYTRYAAGGASLQSLAQWLNSDPRVPRPPKAAEWGKSSLAFMLRLPVYYGAIRFNHDPHGQYEQASREDVFIVEDTHGPLIDRQTWNAVQARMDGAIMKQSYNRFTTPTGRPIALLTGLLLCGDCGSPMYHLARVKADDSPPQYRCLRRDKGASCTAKSYKRDLAHATILADVRRLRGAPWTPQAAERLAGPDGRSQAEAAAAIQRALDDERERLRRHTRRMSEMDDDPTPEQIAAFREVSAEMSARIRGLEAQLTETAQRVQNLPNLHALHEKLTHTELATVIDALDEQGDIEGLRVLLQGIITSARLVDRRPASHPKWLRFDLTWSDDVQTLLDAGLLWLEEAPPAPVESTSAHLRRIREKRYREERKRAALQRAVSTTHIV